MAGKGDKQRPVDKKKFDENFDRIFGKKKRVLVDEVVEGFDHLPESVKDIGWK